MNGVIRSIRAIDWDDDAGWVTVGNWVAPESLSLKDATVIQAGEECEAGWIVTFGTWNSFYEAEIATVCQICREPLGEDATADAICFRDRCHREARYDG